MPISGTQWRYLDKLQSWLQPQLPPAAGLQARLMIAQISQLQTQIHRIEEEIDRQAPFEAAAQRLMEVPGLGKVGAWTILAEIGDITRFPSAKQFVSYCRLVPGAKDSGGPGAISQATRMATNTCEQPLGKQRSPPIPITK